MIRLALLPFVLIALQAPVIRVNGDADAVRMLQLTPAHVALLRERGVLSRTSRRVAVPEIVNLHPIPQSSRANTDARAQARASGIKEADIEIGESIGAIAAGQGGYWFGTTFYNAEGETGTGAIGFLSNSGIFTMLDLPTIRPSSVSALWVDNEVILAGLVHRGERGSQSRGLLRYDRQTRRSLVQPMPDPVHAIVRIGDRVFLGTDQGPRMLRDGTITTLIWN